MPEVTRTYSGIAYRQAMDPDSPWLFSFVASAEELLEWAGIPRRAHSDLVGFQRAADDVRVEKAKTFFQTPTNQSPTSVTLGIHPNVESGVGFEIGEEVAAGSGIRHAVLTISGDFDHANVDSVTSSIAHYIADRLTSSGEEDESTSDRDGIPIDFDDSELDDEDSTLEESLDLGESLLRDLATRLEDQDWVADNMDVLRDLAKPATVIDGQHRILGAQAAERGIPFAVCALIDCPWAEQVFQFTVINYTAKGIADQFITANAALSLTASELQHLESRLQQAGVKVTEYELMTVVNFDAGSPFYDLVDLSESKKGSAERIGYKTMVRIAKAWYDGTSSLFKNDLLPNLYPDVTGAGTAAKAERLSRWRDEDWGDFFLVFWKAAQAKFAGENPDLWKPKDSQLMVAIVLFELQAAFLANLGNQDETFFEVSHDQAEAKQQLLEKVNGRAEKVLEYLPTDFFAAEWAMKSLSTGAGRDALQKAIGELVTKKGKYQWKNSTLVAGAQ